MAYAQKNYTQIQGVNGKYKISQIGCFLTSISNLLLRYGTDIDPARLNNDFVNKGIYIDVDDGIRDDLANNSIVRYDGRFHLVANGTGYPTINDAIVKFKYQGRSGFTTHFCLVADWQNRTIIDSNDGAVKSMSTYGTPLAWYGYTFNQPAPTFSPNPVTAAVEPPKTPSVPPAGAVSLPNTEQYDVIVPVPGYITATDAARRQNPRTTVDPRTYFVFNRRAVSEGVMINVTKEAGRPGAWINTNDNKKPEPIVVPPPVREPVPITNNVVIVPSANSVAGASPQPTQVEAVAPATVEEVSVMEPAKPIDWRTTYEAVNDPRGYVNYMYVGEPTVISDLAGQKRDTKEIREGLELPISGQVLKDGHWYARIHPKVKPAEFEYSWHAIRTVDDHGVENFNLADSEQGEVIRKAAGGLSWVAVGISNILTVLSNFFDMLNDKINKDKKGTN